MGMRTNILWLNTIEYSQSEPHVLDEFRGLTDFYEGLTAGELSLLAKKYLEKNRVSWATVSPKT